MERKSEISPASIIHAGWDEHGVFHSVQREQPGTVFVMPSPTVELPRKRLSFKEWLQAEKQYWPWTLLYIGIVAVVTFVFCEGIQ